MKYKTRTKDGKIQIIQILATTFKKMKVWKLSFTDSKDVILFKIGSQWLQRNEDFLEEFQIISIGHFIDHHEK